MKNRKDNQQPPQGLPVSFYCSDAPFKTLLLLYRHDWRKLVLAMVYYIIKYSPDWIRPVVIANIIDIISRPQEHTLGQLWLNGAILAISLVQNIPMQYLYITTLSAVTRHMETRLRDALTRQLQQLSIGFYKQRTTGALQAKLLRDVEEIQLLANHIFQFVPSAILTILVAVSVTATRAPLFLLFFIATVPTSVVLAEVLKKPIQNCNHDFRQQKEVMSSHLIEMIKLVPMTRAHGVEETEILRTQQRLNSVKKAAMRLDGINAFTGVMKVTIRLFNTLCLITAAYMAYTGKMGVTAGDVILLTYYFDTLANSILQILAVLPQIGTGFESLRSVGEILECPDLEKIKVNPWCNKSGEILRLIM